MISIPTRASWQTNGLTDDGIHDYLTSIRDYSVLEREEVRHLCVAIEVGVLAAERLWESSVHGADGRDLRELVKRGQRSQRKLISHNLKLVVALARRLGAGTGSLADVIQAGNAGLVTAVYRFDHTLGFAFSTYATWWIRKAISLELAEERFIRLPQAPLRRLLDIARVERELSEASGATISSATLAEQLDIPLPEVQLLRRVGMRATSLDQPVNEDSSETLRDTLRAEDDDLANQLHGREVLESLASSLAKLDSLHTDVIALRYGLGGTPPKSMHRVAQLLHVPFKVVLAVEQEALTAIRLQMSASN